MIDTARRSGALRVAVPDLVSNSYFPAVFAVEQDLFAEGGFDAAVELIFPVSAAMDALRRGDVDLVAGAAHATLTAFPEWRGAKLLAALARHMYWFLVVRADLDARRGDVDVVKGLRIGAAPGVDLGLRRLLLDAGVDPVRDAVDIVPVPGLGEGSVSFGVNAAAALRAGLLDGFWANGMGAEVAVLDGAGTVVLDVRRDGPAQAQAYTFAALVATTETVRHRPEVATTAVRALVRAHAALRADPQCATPIGRKLFPPREATLIADLIARDVPYYEPAISVEMVDELNSFARASGLRTGGLGFDDIVASDMHRHWGGLPAT